MGFLIQSNYRQVQARLKSVSPLTAKELRKAELKLVGPIVADARNRASWSNTIPPAIGPTATSRYVGVRVSAKRSRLAVIEERARGKWRHPVFGNRDVWVDQTARQSAKPAVKAAKPAAEVEMRLAFRRAAKEAGFR